MAGKSLIDRKLFGYTLIELMMVISLTMILFTIGLAAYNEFNRRQIITQTAKEIKSYLRLAQSNALSGKKDCQVCGADGDSICGNHPDQEIALSGWYVESLTGSPPTIRLQGKRGSISFNTNSFSVPSSLTVTFGTNPVIFYPLSHGVGVPTGQNAIIIDLNGYEKHYCLQITAVGEIKELGFQTTCI